MFCSLCIGFLTSALASPSTHLDSPWPQTQASDRLWRYTELGAAHPPHPNPQARPVGRGATVLSGNTESDFDYLYGTDMSPYAWVVDPTSIVNFLWMKPREIIDFIGYPMDWVESASKEGTVFKLAGFRFKDVPYVTRADWDGMYRSLVDGSQATMYSRVVAKKFLETDPKTHMSVMDVLKHHTFAEIESTYGSISDLSAIQQQSVTGFNNFAQSGLSGVRWVRAFLMYTMDCNDLYGGDGFTVDDAGKVGGPEWLATPIKISGRPNTLLTDLPLNSDKTLQELNPLWAKGLWD